MITINSAFWAKKQDKTGKFEWLSLAQHLEDTRQIARLLWMHWLSEGQRQRIIASLSVPDEDVAANLAEFLGAVHDLGKATPAFQMKSGFKNSPDLDSMLIEMLEGAGFSDLRLTCLANPEKSPHAVAGQYLLSEYGANEDIASIVGAHHGKPADDNIIIENQSAYSSNYYQVEDSHHSIHQKWKNEQRNIFDRALESSGFESINSLPSIQQPGQVLLSGLLIMADWIASNEAYFPLVSLQTATVDDQQARVEHGFTKWLKDASYPWEAKLHAPHTLYERRFDFTPRNVQSVFTEVIENAENPGIFILEAPMGLGKTEAALVAVEQLAQKTGRSGLFFGLPTQATSNGMFPRVNAWLEKVAKDFDDKLGLRLLHGKASLNPDFDSLNRSAQNINIDGEANGSVTVNAWFSGRKTASLDDFVVGTVDQFLMVALKQKHLALRHLGFSKKVVVIDEVHAYDAYMSQYLYQAVRWMGAYGVPVIILSATLPTDRRAALVEQYLRGAGYKLRDCTRPQDGLDTDAYPLITYSDGKAIKQMHAFAPIENKPVRIVRYECYEIEGILPLVADLFRDGGIIGIIVNTVKRAQALAKACSEQFGMENVSLLHSAFIATDRIEKEARLIQTIGKGANRPHQKIIIGTQVIEQSLDIDFDVLISDLAPIDLLIQRIGRLHRHDIKRPKKHKAPVLYVLGTHPALEFESGSLAVYGGYLLARTQVLLPDILSIPQDISPLVQKVYGREDLDISEELQPCYAKMKIKQETSFANQELKAKTYRIDNPLLQPKLARSASLVGWLKNSTPNESEEKAYAQVRDTQETLEVIALQKIGNGYGFIGTGEDLSKRIDDSIIAKKIAQQTLRLPNVLSAPYRIDHTIQELEEFNLNCLKDWQSQPWLKGALGILFDQDYQFMINGYILKYDKNYGLIYMEGGNGAI
ncbi:MAG: CRISPR-associated helicase Cas3' [Christensenellales bacterium]|jgi:CRISPR-associated endonuclease/helicase Cas3